MYSDKTLTCRDCGADFIFTAGEQEFHASKGFTNEPRRCPDCRQAKKASEGRGGGGGGFRSEGGGGYGGQREMFTATCAGCGNEAQVPFEPDGRRPVYCADCFRNQPRTGSPRGGSRRY